MEHSILEEPHKGSKFKKVLIIGLAVLAIAAGTIYFSDDEDPGPHGAGFPQCPPKCALNPY